MSIQLFFILFTQHRFTNSPETCHSPWACKTKHSHPHWAHTVQILAPLSRSLCTHKRTFTITYSRYVTVQTFTTSNSHIQNNDTDILQESRACNIHTLRMSVRSEFGKNFNCKTLCCIWKRKCKTRPWNRPLYKNTLLVQNREHNEWIWNYEIRTLNFMQTNFKIKNLQAVNIYIYHNLYSIWRYWA
jgi:hypothetical protein